jgi:hypothetical protein
MTNPNLAPLILRIEYSKWDFKAANKAKRKIKSTGSRPTRREWFTLIVLLGLIVAVRWSVYGDGVIVSTLTVEALTFGAVLLVQYPGRLGDAAGLWEYRFSPEHIVYVRRTVESLLPWSYFQSYTLTDKHLFIWTHKGDPIIVPKKAFHSADEFQRLLELVKSKLRLGGLYSTPFVFMDGSIHFLC